MTSVREAEKLQGHKLQSNGETESREFQSSGGVPEKVLTGAYPVSLSFFSGPMDLLLHLVKQQEVSIDKVEMRIIAEQYLKIVFSDAGSLDLEKAGEYLVIAATLMDIKSRALIPNENVEIEGSSFDDGSRFFEDLREKLKVYELTKQRAHALVNHPQLGFDTFVRQDKAALQPGLETLADGEDPASLGRAFVNLLKRVGGGVKNLKVRLEPISVVSFMMKIVDRLQEVARLSSSGNSNGFKRLVFSFFKESSKNCDNTRVHARSVIVGTFIAVLELSRRGLLVATQASDNAEIDMALRIQVSENEAQQFRSEFDEDLTVENQISNKVIDIAQYLEHSKADDMEYDFEEDKLEVNKK